MKQLAVWAALSAALSISGCASEKSAFDPDKPLDKMTKDEWCSYYHLYLTNPQISAESRRSATTQMRQRGCPTIG